MSSWCLCSVPVMEVFWLYCVFVLNHTCGVNFRGDACLYIRCILCFCSAQGLSGSPGALLLQIASPTHEGLFQAAWDDACQTHEVCSSLRGGGGGLPQNVKLVPYDVSEEMSSVSNPEQALWLTSKAIWTAWFGFIEFEVCWSLSTSPLLTLPAGP